jgi:hypothetical protein
MMPSATSPSLLALGRSSQMTFVSINSSFRTSPVLSLFLPRVLDAMIVHYCQIVMQLKVLGIDLVVNWMALWMHIELDGCGMVFDSDMLFLAVV